MADIKQFVSPDNLGPDFEQDATAKEIKVNIDGVTLIRNAEGKLEAVGDGVGVSKEYVDDLTAVDGTTIVRNDDGKLEAVGGGASATHDNSIALGSGSKTAASSQLALAALTVDAEGNETGNATSTCRISGVSDPLFGYDVVTKSYHDAAIAALTARIEALES